MLNHPETIGIALKEQRWDLLHAVAAFVESNPLSDALAFTDPALFRRLSSQIANYKLAGFGKLDVAKLDNLASRMRTPPVTEATQRIAQTVRQLRCEQGLTQEDLSEASGIALGTLRVFEQSGKISLDRLIRILDALDSRDKLHDLIMGNSVEVNQKPPISARI